MPRIAEQILRDHVEFSDEHWRIHEYSDLHLTAAEGLKVGMVNAVKDFVPPRGQRVTNI